MGLCDHGGLGPWGFGALELWDKREFDPISFGTLAPWYVGPIGFWPHMRLSPWEIVSVGEYPLGIWPHRTLAPWEFGPMFGVWPHGRLSTFGSCWSLLAPCWPLLTSSGPLWSILAYVAPFMVSYSSMWTMLAPFCPFWLSLAPYCPYLKTTCQNLKCAAMHKLCACLASFLPNPDMTCMQFPRNHFDGFVYLAATGSMSQHEMLSE